LVAAAKLLVAETKILSVVPNFVAVTTPFFFRVTLWVDVLHEFTYWVVWFAVD